MSSQEPQDVFEDLVAPWVLGALEPADAQLMSEHLETCAECQESARRLSRVVGVLPLAAEEASPPLDLRERILAAAQISQVGAVHGSVVRRPRVAARPRTSMLGRLNRQIPFVAAAAAVVVALIVGLVAGDVGLRGSAPTASPQVVRFTLSGHQQLATASATVIDLKTDGLALVDFTGLPALAAGRVYEVWLITPGGRPDPVGVFVPDTNGGRVVLVNRSTTGYSQMAITRENGPDGASAPTEQPQLYGNVS